MVCVWCSQFIPQISALDPVTTAIPLAIVLGITAMKDLVDDIVSWRNDSLCSSCSATNAVAAVGFCIPGLFFWS